MIFKLLLSAGLVVIFAYAFAHRVKSPWVGLTALPLSITGVYFVWNPTVANHIANSFGIGRGADLLFYCYFVMNFIVLLNVHFKIRESSESLTILVRRISILEAQLAERGVIPNEFQLGVRDHGAND